MSDGPKTLAEFVDRGPMFVVALVSALLVVVMAPIGLMARVIVAGFIYGWRWLDRVMVGEL